MEYTNNKQHYVEEYPPFTRRPTGDHAIADESQETGRLVDPLDQWYEDVTQVPEIPGQRGAKRRPDERKYHDTEALESRIEVPETPAHRGVKRSSDEQLQEDTETSVNRIEVPETPGLRRVIRRSEEQLQEDTEASESRIEVPETPGLRGVIRRSEEQLQEDTEASESRIDGTCTQDNSLRRMKRRRTGVG